jgi:hypothetical protein
MPHGSYQLCGEWNSQQLAALDDVMASLPKETTDATTSISLVGYSRRCDCAGSNDAAGRIEVTPDDIRGTLYHELAHARTRTAMAEGFGLAWSVQHRGLREGWEEDVAEAVRRAYVDKSVKIFAARKAELRLLEGFGFISSECLARWMVGEFLRKK